MQSVFRPLQAAIGGLLIGTAVGMYMLLAKKIGGHSGMLKSLVVGPREASKLTYLLGLAVAGAVLAAAVPHTFFEKPKDPELSVFALGVVMGIGTHLGNGCTSGHGLCGLSRLSYRSFAAVPVFMICAILASSASSGFALGSPAPVAAMEDGTAHAVALIVGVLAILLVPVSLLVLKSKATALAEAVLGLWCGLCGGAGLTIGGMVRPSSVQAALSLQRTDFTLWTLFMVALLTTFGFYRFAKYRGVAEACTVKQGRIDWQLLLGAALFGIGWGATGACPGPLVVIVGADPLAMGPLLILLGVSAGVLIASAVTSALVKPPSQAKTKPPAHAIHPDGPPPPSPLLSPPTAASNECFPSAAELRDALDAGAVLVDLRNPVSSEATGGALLVADGAVSAPWDRATRSVPLTALPSDKAQPLVLMCHSGNRAAQGAAYLAEAGYTRVLNGGGPGGPQELWQLLCEKRGALSYPTHGVQWRQLFDDGPTGAGSSTLTYVLMDEATKEALIIDPVLEQVSTPAPSQRGPRAPKRAGGGRAAEVRRPSHRWTAILPPSKRWVGASCSRSTRTRTPTTSRARARSRRGCRDSALQSALRRAPRRMCWSPTARR